jgi:hypothetical protein
MLLASDQLVNNARYSGYSQTRVEVVDLPKQYQN